MKAPNATKATKTLCALLALLSVGAMLSPCDAQHFWSLASPDPRWNWEDADSAIRSARTDLDTTRRQPDDDSRAAAYASVRLSELLQFKCDTCRVECIETANRAYQIAVRDSGHCDSLLIIAAFTWDAARERYNPWADRYTEIRSALDTCFACEWCDSLRMARILQRVTSSHFHGGQYEIGRAYLRRALGIFERNDKPDSLNVLACVWALRSATERAESQLLLERAENLGNHAAKFGANVYPPRSDLEN
ncbi:MAG: hypothetical protein IPG71_00295 [bacterium]|nr:hypothetical protein [bacterium]